MLSLHTNPSLLTSQNIMRSNQETMSQSMARLSSGKRVMRARDDVAGFQIAGRISSDITVMSTSIDNTKGAQSMLQTAGGALDELGKISQRMLELATQSADGSKSDDDRKALQKEFNKLAETGKSILDNTSFGGRKLLEKSNGAIASGPVKFQVGQSANDTVEMDVKAGFEAMFNALTSVSTKFNTGAVPVPYTLQQPDVVTAINKMEADFGSMMTRQATATTGETYKTQLTSAFSALTAGPNASVITGWDKDQLERVITHEIKTLSDAAGTAGGNAVVLSAAEQKSLVDTFVKEMSPKLITSTAAAAGNEIENQNSAQTAMTNLQTAINATKSVQAEMGAVESQLDAVRSNLEVGKLNAEDSRGRIMDTDYAVESSVSMRAQIQDQVAQQMLKRSAMQSQSILGLIAG